mmetsp:Transcript_11631/g.21750  ORF Transcript_11631/g.21750 Transcript_11631/m.21750 type:complete len:490 (+) Transcript_11631:468-1937(+)|eukprot:CAMPEP_0176498796 /NCGR_PEP_ID=MMETSP0200_2-20121128/12544_1 /TAXON_ID=947934 /ORGANISM="Chaetoceros sp., Strain GSL56" /LENGTH=489 /DNA_ID=CAMNT_0017897091 /DNA_START=467 /DNA_END=1936 /DNA_ORIENTATION=+
MPPSSSFSTTSSPSRRPSHNSQHGRTKNADLGQEDERFQGPIDSILYMLTGACSSMYHLFSTSNSSRSGRSCNHSSSSSSSNRRKTRRNPKWDGGYDDDVETMETTSYSSSDRDRDRDRDRSSSKHGATRQPLRSSHMPRSRSHSVRAGMRKSSPPPMWGGGGDDDYDDMKHKLRSRSLSKSHFDRRRQGHCRTSSPLEKKIMTTTRPVLRENTEIHLKQSDQEDDISAISAGTLEHMEKMYILQQANKSLLVNKQQQQQQDQQLQQRQQDHQQHGTEWNDNDIHTHDNHVGIGSNKENMEHNGRPYCLAPLASPDRSSCASFKSQVSSNAILSMASSTGTSEFESIWNHRRTTLHNNSGSGGSGRSSSTLRHPIQQLQKPLGGQGREQVEQDRQQLQQQQRQQQQPKETLTDEYEYDYGNHIRRDVDDNPIGVALTSKTKTHKQKTISRRSKSAVMYETPSTRRMKRRIQMDWIGTIDEGIYSDEEEI